MYQNLQMEMKQRFEPAYEWLLEVLLEVDPAGGNFEINADEYEPEVSTILPRSSSCASVERVLAGKFRRWFGREHSMRPGSCQVAAKCIWTHVLPLLP